jgi:hypothetical protein
MPLATSVTVHVIAQNIADTTHGMPQIKEAFVGSEHQSFFLAHTES